MYVCMYIHTYVRTYMHVCMCCGRWRIAKQTVSTILSTLTRDDFVNVITYRSSHWDYNSNYYSYRNMQVLGCRQNALQSATAARQQELMDRLNEFAPAGGSDPM